MTFVKEELNKIQKVLSSGFPECPESQKEELKLEEKDKEQWKNSREPFLKITVHFLRKMKQEDLADQLQKSRFIALKI